MSSHSDHGQGASTEDAARKDEKSKRFRFKRTHSEAERRHGDEAPPHRHRHHHHHHRHHHRTKRRRTSPRTVDDPSAYDDSASKLPPDVAFRESLFDALGDDEGAAYWEGVYGQPIHNYPNTYQNETGDLERMDDEEYAQHVRRKMWEKSWEGIEAAKEEQRKTHERDRRQAHEQESYKTQERRQYREPDYLFDLDIDRSLRRGERRKEKKHWKKLWESYLQRWNDLLALGESRSTIDNEHLFLRNKIAWPVESGKRKDVNSDEIEKFIKCYAEAMDEDRDILTSLLKIERVRWHPDKIQQRYGFMGIDDSTMEGVTAVFQVFDRLWGEIRDNKA